MNKEALKTGKHIGDGVYVSYDGFNIIIAVNHHNNKVVYLEPKVVEALMAYIENLQEA